MKQKFKLHLPDENQIEKEYFEKLNITELDNNVIKSVKLMQRAEYLLDKQDLTLEEQKELAWIMDKTENLLIEEKHKMEEEKSKLNQNHTA